MAACARGRTGMYDETGIARRTIMLYAAGNALFSTAAAVSAVWSGAPLMPTIAWILSIIIHVSVALFMSIRVHRPALVPVIAANMTMRQEAQPGAYNRNRY